MSSAANQNLSFAQGLQNQGPTAYTNPMVANFSPQQSSSFDMADTIGASPNLPTAGGYINNAATAGPGSVDASTIASKMDPYMNAYVAQSLAPQLEAQNQQFATQNRGAASNSTMAGAFGNDSQDALYRSNLTNQQDIGRMGLIGNAYNTAFNTAIGAGAQDVSNNLNAQTTNQNLREQALQRQMQGASGLEGLTTAQEGAAGFVNQMGQQQTAQQQAQLNAQYQEFLRQQQYPFQTTELLNQTIGAGSGAMPASTQTTTTAPDNSGFQVAGAIAKAAIPAAMSFMADGGELQPGQTAMVGERGPELAIPSMTPGVHPMSFPSAPQMPSIPMMPAVPQAGQPAQPQAGQPTPSNAPLAQLMAGYNGAPNSFSTSIGETPRTAETTLSGAMTGETPAMPATDPGMMSSSLGETPMMGFAAGGAPPVGQPSIVGENGPEIIVPNQATTIIPHEALKAAAAKKDKKPQPFDDVLGMAA